MRPIYNRYLVKPLVTDNPLNIIGLNGLPFLISPQFNPNENTPQFATIVKLPYETDGKFKLLPEGTNVFIDYLACTNDNKVIIDDEDYYLCETQFVWATIEYDGDTQQIIPMDNFILCQKVIDDTLEEGGLIVKLYEENVKHKFIVLSKGDKEYQEGQVVYMMGGEPTPIPDSELVLVRKSTILVKQEGAIFIPMNERHLIQEDESPDFNYWKDLLVSNKQIHRFKTGIYAGGSKEHLTGKRVTFIHSLFTNLSIDEIKYACIKDSDLIFE